jgi:uncharacterized protein YjiS (DUF1127 family)
MAFRSASSNIQMIAAPGFLPAPQRWAKHAMNRFELAAILNKALTDLSDFLRRHQPNRLAHGIA